MAIKDKAEFQRSVETLTTWDVDSNELNVDDHYLQSWIRPTSATCSLDHSVHEGTAFFKEVVDRFRIRKFSRPKKQAKFQSIPFAHLFLKIWRFH